MMLKNKLKIGILGCGRIFDHYIGKILCSNELINLYKVVAVCDADQKKAKRAGELIGCDYFTQITEFLNKESMDIVLILTKSGQHYEHSKMCLNANFNVIVEKPLSLRVEHVKDLIELSNNSGKFCCSVFQNRFNPAVEVTKKAFQTGRFGDLVSVSVRLRWCRLQDYYNDGWHGTWAQDGGVTNQQAIHHVDALTWICGEARSVSAISDRRANQLEAEDTLVAAIELENGGLATLELTTAARPKDLEASITITGTKGVAEIGGIALNKINKWAFLEKEPTDETILSQFSEEVENGYGISHYRQLKEVYENFNNGCNENVPFSAKSCLHTLRLIHSIYASVELKRRINISENISSSKLGK